MKIKILGTRGEVEESSPQHAKHSGVLIDDTILLDLGEKEFLKYRPKAIFITHLHPDHAVFIMEPLQTDIPVYAPESYQDGVKVQVVSDEITIDSYKIKPIPTHHSKKVKSQGYIITKNDQKLLYTGDLVWINKEYHNLLEDADLVITDGSIWQKGGRVVRDKDSGQIYGHNGIPDLINLFKRFTKTILFLHFGSWFYEDVQGAARRLEDLGREFGVKVLVGRDGWELDLPVISKKKEEDIGLDSRQWLESFKDRRPR